MVMPNPSGALPCNASSIPSDFLLLSLAQMGLSVLQQPRDGMAAEQEGSRKALETVPTFGEWETRRSLSLADLSTEAGPSIWCPEGAPVSKPGRRRTRTSTRAPEDEIATERPKAPQRHQSLPASLLMTSVMLEALDGHDHGGLSAPLAAMVPIQGRPWLAVSAGARPGKPARVARTQGSVSEAPQRRTQGSVGMGLSNGDSTATSSSGTREAAGKEKGPQEVSGEPPVLFGASGTPMFRFPESSSEGRADAEEFERRAGGPGIGGAETGDLQKLESGASKMRSGGIQVGIGAVGARRLSRTFGLVRAWDDPKELDFGLARTTIDHLATGGNFGVGTAGAQCGFDLGDVPGVYPGMPRASLPHVSSLGDLVMHGASTSDSSHALRVRPTTHHSVSSSPVQRIGSSWFDSSHVSPQGHPPGLPWKAPATPHSPPSGPARCTSPAPSADAAFGAGAGLTQLPAVEDMEGASASDGRGGERRQGRSKHIAEGRTEMVQQMASRHEGISSEYSGRVSSQGMDSAVASTSPTSSLRSPSTGRRLRRERKVYEEASSSGPRDPANMTEQFLQLSNMALQLRASSRSPTPQVLNNSEKAQGSLNPLHFPSRSPKSCSPTSCPTSPSKDGTGPGSS